jgi:hypothetical protein
MKILISFLISLVIVESAYAIGQINIAYSPYTISSPGSYIVVKDLTTAINLNCITITTSNVTLDLNGHTLYGYGTTQFYSGTYGTGILGTTLTYISGSSTVYDVNNVSITNGRIMNFRNYGVYLSGYNFLVSKLQVYSNVSGGIILNSQNAHVTSVVKDNIVMGNYGDGIDAGNGAFVTGNNVQSNASTGIFANYACFIKDNICRLNQLDGIRVYTENQVLENECNDNTIAGIEAQSDENSIIGNYCSLNGTGLLSDNSGNYFEQNKLTGNTTDETLNGSTEGTGTLADVQF